MDVVEGTAAEVTEVVKRVKLYVCPTEGCTNFFGHSSMSDLSKIVTGDRGQNFERRPESSWFKRSQCPDCRSRGLQVDRVLVTVNVKVPVNAPGDH